MSDRKSDREGYEKFRRKVEKGDVVLHLRAAEDWRRSDHEPKTERAHYFELFTAEKQIREILTRRADHVVRDLQPAFRALRNPVHRRDAEQGVRAAAQEWEDHNFQTSNNETEMHDFHLGQDILSRLAENPRQTRGQAWFHAQLQLRTDFLHQLNQRKKELELTV